MLVKSIKEIRLETEKAWKDLTIQYEVELTCAAGNIKHWFNTKGYVNESDYQEPTDKNTGLLYGTQQPKGHSFMSTDGYSERYLVNNKTGQRVIHNFSKVVVNGKTSVMTDDKIDALIDAGTEVEILVESKTRTAQRMFVEFALDCGVTPGEEFSFEDITGAEVGVMVRENLSGRTTKSGKIATEVHYFMDKEKCEAQLALQD